MWGDRSTFRMSATGYLAMAICLLAGMVETASAHQSGTHPAPSDARDRMSEMRERRLRETQLRSIETRLKETAKEDGPDPTLEQAEQDFKRILVLHNELARNISAGGPLDYKLVSDAAGEINKRANRLKKFVVPVEPKDDDKDDETRVELNGKQLKVALDVLCQRIESFFENPMFKVPGMVDVKEADRAGSDLLRIIKLSETIKKDAGRLTKSLK